MKIFSKLILLLCIMYIKDIQYSYSYVYSIYVVLKVGNGSIVNHSDNAVQYATMDH